MSALESPTWAAPTATSAGAPPAGRAWETLPEPVRRRLVLEHDDLRFSAADTLWIHERTGVPLVFDHQHFRCLNPEALDLRDTLARMLVTWPAGARPKVHVSSPKTDFRQVHRKDSRSGKTTTAALPPVWTGHADFVHPFEFIGFMRHAEGLDFDVMLEAKGKDLALLRLRPISCASHLTSRRASACSVRRNRRRRDARQRDRGNRLTSPCRVQGLA